MDRDETFRRMAVLRDDAFRHLRAAKEVMEGTDPAIDPPANRSLTKRGISEELKQQLEQRSETRRRAIRFLGAALDAMQEVNRLRRDYMRDGATD